MKPTWQCSQCRTLNEDEHRSCLACGGPRPLAGFAPVSSQAPAAPGQDSTQALPLTPFGQAAPRSQYVTGPIVAGQEGAGAAAVAGPGSGSGGGGKTALMVAAVVIAVIVVAAGAFMVTSKSSGSGDERVETAANTDDESSSEDASRRSGDSNTADGTTTSKPAPELATSTAPTISDTAAAVGAGRGATLWAGEAVLRTEPSSTSSEVWRYKDRDGMALEVMEEATPETGWYRVRVVDDEREGYMFAAFVVPPPAGLCIGVTQSGTAVVYDSSGGVFPSSATTGTKVLVVDQDAGGGQWEVLLPEGQHGWVNSADFGESRCG